MPCAVARCSRCPSGARFLLAGCLLFSPSLLHAAEAEQSEGTNAASPAHRAVEFFFEQFDLDESGRLEEVESRLLRLDVSHLDSDGDGAVDRKELQEAIGKVLEKAYGKEAAALLEESSAKVNDSPASDQTDSTPASHLQVERVRLKLQTHRNAAKLLAKYDADGDGVLNAKERQVIRNFKSGQQDRDTTLDDLVRWHKAQRARIILNQPAREPPATAGGPSSSSAGTTSAGTKRAKPSYAGLPGWFAEKDHNGDRQIEMYEYTRQWTESDVLEFLSHDLNGDGIITSAECTAKRRTSAPEKRRLAE